VSSIIVAILNTISIEMPEHTVPFVDFNLQRDSLASDVQGALMRVIDRGWFILGPEVEAFEQEFASFVGAAQAVGVASGTDALSLSLMGLGVGPGDEVVTSPLTATFTALAISRIGARPVFADVHPETLSLSPRAVAERLSERTKAILPVHLYGNPCDLPAFRDLARANGLGLVEDACQAHGSKLGGRPVGSWGDTGCFSFYPTKNLGALGDGGIITTTDEKLAVRLRRLRNGGQVNRYVHEEVGFNSRLDEIQAAVLRAKLPRLPQWNRRRGALARLYDQLLEGTPVKTIQTLEGAEPVTHLYVVRALDREGLQESLIGEGIQTLIHYPIPAHLQPAYVNLGQGEGSCPAAERAAREVLSLPLYPEMTESQVERVAEAVRTYYR
jgi:dTDP-4-amino-4,6-dideoxygalactose transaminase